MSQMDRQTDGQTDDMQSHNRAHNKNTQHTHITINENIAAHTRRTRTDQYIQDDHAMHPT